MRLLLFSCPPLVAPRASPASLKWRSTYAQLPYACKLLFQELQSMNVVPRLKLRDY